MAESRIGDRERQLRAWFTRGGDPLQQVVDGLDIGWGGVQRWATARMPAVAGWHLDVACGYATFLAQLGWRFPEARLVGLNIDFEGPHSLARPLLAEAGVTAALVRGDALRLPYAGDSFDSAGCFLGLQDVEIGFGQEGVRQVVAETCRVLRPGGTLVVLDEFPFERFDRLLDGLPLAVLDRAERALDACWDREVAERAPAARLVYVSSLAAAGPSQAPDGVGPEVEPAPVSWYGHSKLAAELELRSTSAPGRWRIVRPPAIYGPRDTDIFEFFRMAGRGLVAIPGGERWLTVAWVGDVVRSICAAAVSAPGSIFHVGEPLPLRLDELVAQLCRAGGVRARVLHLPAGLVRFAGTVGSGLQRLGWHRLALTADKSRELLARHWTARTADSLAALGVGDLTPFAEGAERTWEWYRGLGWLG